MSENGEDRHSTQPQEGIPGSAASGGPPGLPVGLQRYIAAVSIFGPLLVASVAIANLDGITFESLLVAGLLLVLGATAIRYPLQLRVRTLISVTGAVFLMCVLGLPLALPGVVAMASIWLGNIRRPVDRLELAFDSGQFGLSVTVSALFFNLVRDRSWLGPSVGEIGNVPAIVLTAAICFLFNYALVSIAAALQQERNPLRVWIQNVREDVSLEASLAGTGVIGAILAVNEPVTLPLLAVPFILLHRALEHATRLRTDTFAALMKLNEVVEIRDPYTAGHSIRVGETSRAIALRLGLTMEEAEEVGKAGGIHDVGKIGIDPDILTNTGRLTAQEMDQMRTHPRLGADIVSRFSTSGPITSYVLHHHEWWNGNGYPAGLVGEQIPLGARIIAVADTFDALTSKRPYREPLSSADALLILRDGSGTQWDTEVVAAFFGYAKSIGIPLPKTDNPMLLRWANGTTA
jgi:HD-GYP domain-containing protein (c-di-GMP phosphodiesterase class II)